jgi:hypothetical protein
MIDAVFYLTDNGIKWRAMPDQSSSTAATARAFQKSILKLRATV